MSVQDGERLATKQDLADMYQGILPYLGGMPEMVANKFSKGDLYSTDEKMIGQWIDGKPLYQRTFHLTNPTGEWVANSLGFTADKVFLVDTCYIANWMGGCSYYSSSSNMASIFAYKDTTTNDVSIWIRSTSTITDLYVTLRYTKTNDTAISIGDETDYSTTEKIVGTWIDGSTLYQKTLQITMPTANESIIATDIASGNHARIIDGFIEQTGSSGNNYTFPLLFLNGSPLTMNVLVQVTVDASKLYVWSNFDKTDGKTAYVTIQYTKTT